jgi:hypothetical protein
VASWRALEKAGLKRVAEGPMSPDNPIDDALHYIYRVDRPGAAGGLAPVGTLMARSVLRGLRRGAGWMWCRPLACGFLVERVTRIELALSAWEADVLPLNYTRNVSPAPVRAR